MPVKFCGWWFAAKKKKSKKIGKKFPKEKKWMKR